MSLGWSAESVARATKGSLSGDPTVVVDRIATDSRCIVRGDCFVAIVGEQFDGHDFVEVAADAGASCVLVGPHRTGRAAATTPAMIEVADTLVALRDVAALRRQQLEMPVVAVTGSSGKTSTKDLLAAVLPDSHTSEKSFNNEIGVPLTVLNCPQDAAYLVLEVGSRGRGHIDWLMPAVRPDVSIITNLGVAHLEMFGDVATLADAKWELAAGLDRGGTAVVPVDDPRMHRSHEGRTLTFGFGAADIAVSELVLSDRGLPSFTIATPDESGSVTLPVAGHHQALNAAAAVGAGYAVGVDLPTMLDGLRHATGSPWRMEIRRGSFTVVNDAYNANPDSVRAALNTVAVMPGRHIAVLGKMAELGPIEAEEHQRMGAEAERLGYHALIVVGEDPGLIEGASKIGTHVDNVTDALALLRGMLEPDDVVLVKASRSVGLEVLAADLVKDSA